MKKMLAKTLACALVSAGLALPAAGQEVPAAAPPTPAAPPAAGQEAPAPPAAPKPDWGKEVGDLVKPMTLKYAAGGEGEVKTRGLAKDTLFVMVSSVCTQCRKEVGELESNARSFKAKDMDVLLVVIDMDPEAGATRISAFSKLPMVADGAFALGEAVGLTMSPSSLLVGKDGKIKAKQAGYAKDDYKKFLQ